MDSIVIFGAGGHAQVIADLAEKTGRFRIEAAVVPAGFASGARWMGYPLVAEEQFLASPSCNRGVIGVGDNAVREKIAKLVESRVAGFEWASLVHPSAVLARDVNIGPGSVVMAGAIVQVGTRVGRHCIVNTASALDHENVLEDFASVAPGAILGGKVRVGRSSAISLGAHVYQGVKIGADTVVGGGALVNKDLPERVVAFGVPCRVIRSRQHGNSYLS